VAQVARQWSTHTAIELRFEQFGEEATVSEDVFELLLGATREALNNVRKHAKANLVNVTLTFLTRQLALDVRDNGLGPSADAKDRLSQNTGLGGFGLTTLRERVTERNGQLVIEHSPGEGFTLSIQLPLGAA
jgi:signal transduction histidine kinase